MSSEHTHILVHIHQQILLESSTLFLKFALFVWLHSMKRTFKRAILGPALCNPHQCSEIVSWEQQQIRPQRSLFSIAFLMQEGHLFSLSLCFVHFFLCFFLRIARYLDTIHTLCSLVSTRVDLLISSIYLPAPLSGIMIQVSKYLCNLYTWLHLYSTQPNRILSTLLPGPVSVLQLTKQFVKKRNHEDWIWPQV